LNITPGKRSILINTHLGLTQSVAKSLSIIVSPDVESDRFWSGASIEGSEGCRAFLGTPLVIESDGGSMLYGVLTLTRLRIDVADTRP
jgi:hypothetical protein